MIRKVYQDYGLFWDMKIGVYGSSGKLDSRDVSQKAREIGKEIARRGHIVVTGGCGGFPHDVVMEHMS